MEAGGDNSIQFEIQNMQQALMLLEQRTQDLRTAESVAMLLIFFVRHMIHLVELRFDIFESGLILSTLLLKTPAYSGGSYCRAG